MSHLARGATIGRYRAAAEPANGIADVYDASWRGLPPSFLWFNGCNSPSAWGCLDQVGQIMADIAADSTELAPAPQRSFAPQEDDKPDSNRCGQS
jgi:hypothetical protein